jgi:hypothetical protein
MTRIGLSRLPARKPGTTEEEIDRWVAMLSSIKNADMRCRALQGYVRWLRAPRPEIEDRWDEKKQRSVKGGRGRLANPEARREQLIADWDTFDAVEAIILQGRCKSPTKACELLATDRGLYRSPKRGHKGENESPESKFRKAYKRHTQTCFYPASSRLAPELKKRQSAT